MKKKILAIVEARMNSKRLYGKVLKKINGVEILKIILDRLETSKKISEVIVATSNNREDDSIVKLLNKKKFKYFRGSEKNLIKRLIGAAEKFNADIVVRLTADNPLIYSKSIDFMINFYKKNLKFDYITNNNFGNLKKRNLALGLDISLFKLKKLKLVERYARKLKNRKKYQEHPTLYFNVISNNKFKVKNIKLPKDHIVPKKFRLTIDTKEDYAFFEKLFKSINKNNKKIVPKDVNKALIENPELGKINKEVKQYVPKIY